MSVAAMTKDESKRVVLTRCEINDQEIYVSTNSTVYCNMRRILALDPEAVLA